MAKPLHAIQKTYPSRGSIQQFRLETAISFACFRCGQKKTSKLVAVHRGDWNQLLCNGCYGRLLSIYDIQAGTKADDEKAEDLAKLLLGLASEDQQRGALDRSGIALDRTRWLSETSLRFISTSEFVAQHLGSEPSMDWSPAIIGLCKAFEIELVRRVIDELRKAVAGKALAADEADKDFGRVAKYCAGKSATPPEIGTIGHFLQTAAHSQSRIASSILLQELKAILGQWPKSLWLIDNAGAIGAMTVLTKQFRNRAAHIEELSSRDYASCFELVVGKDGMLWKLLEATTPRRR